MSRDRCQLCRATSHCPRYYESPCQAPFRSYDEREFIILGSNLAANIGGQRPCLADTQTHHELTSWFRGCTHRNLMSASRS
jgi:hypothetical protein